MRTAPRCVVARAEHTAHGDGHAGQMAQRINQGKIDELAFAGALAMIKSGANCGEGVHAADTVGQGAGTRIEGRPVGFAHEIEDAARGKGNQIVTGAICVWATLAEAGKRAHDYPRIQWAQY